MYICVITRLSGSMIQQTFIFLLSIYFVLPFELIPTGPNVYCPEFRRNSSKKFNGTVNVKCDPKNSDKENWSEHVSGKDQEKYCRKKCLEQAKEKGYGCCEAILYQSLNVTSNTLLYQTECLFRPKVGFIPDVSSNTKAILCKACTNITFGCKDQKSCIDDDKRCDGIRDCEDGSDETGCSCSAIAENLLSTITFPSNPTSDTCDTMLQLQKLLQAVVNSYTSKEITTATSKPTTETATTIDIKETATTMDTAIRMIGTIEQEMTLMMKIPARTILNQMDNRLFLNAIDLEEFENIKAELVRVISEVYNHSKDQIATAIKTDETNVCTLKFYIENEEQKSSLEAVMANETQLIARLNDAFSKNKILANKSVSNLSEPTYSASVIKCSHDLECKELGNCSYCLSDGICSNFELNKFECMDTETGCGAGDPCEEGMCRPGYYCELENSTLIENHIGLLNFCNGSRGTGVCLEDNKTSPTSPKSSTFEVETLIPTMTATTTPKLEGLNCVPGYRLSDWTSYVSNWDGTIPIGEDDSIRDDCLRLAQKNVKDLVGIYWNFAGGYCRAITSYQSLLPWPNSFPQDKSTTKLCVFSHLIEETKCDIEERTLKRGGYSCNSSCINENIGYKNLSMAWDKCIEVECCTRIFRWTNGSHYYYYLRKADDIFDNSPRFYHINFNHVCRATNCVVEDMTLQTGGYDCNGTCINDNTGYYNWSMAWNVCKEINSCTRITRWTDGSLYYYYLRKANDIFNSNPRFLHVNFPPKCRVNCNVDNLTLSRGGYRCNNNNCINNNTGYNNLSTAWERCAEVESCNRIFRWTNGSHYYYYLRKADDIFDCNPRYLHVDFHPECRVSSTTIATLGSGVTDTIESTTQTAISNLSTSLGLTDGINLTTAQTEIGSFSTRSDEMESTESTEIITTNSLIAVTTTFKSTSINIFDPETTTQSFDLEIMEKSNNIDNLQEGQQFELFCITNSPQEIPNFETCKWSKKSYSSETHEWCFKPNAIRCKSNGTKDYVKASENNHECRIIIDNATPKDSGNWTCMLTDPAGTGKEALGVIQVKVTEQILPEAPDVPLDDQNDTDASITLIDQKFPAIYLSALLFVLYLNA